VLLHVGIAKIGRRIVEGPEEQAVELWDPAQVQLMRTLVGHTALVPVS
jgi:hypothetical protein